MNARFYIKTLGCKVNQCDSNNIARKFFEAGWIEEKNPVSPGLCIINTCAVTSHADRKSRNAIGSIINKFPNAKIFVTGCYALYDPDAIKKIPGVSGIIKKENINSLLKKFRLPRNKKKAPNQLLKNRVRAFIKIQDGCNNSCSYCVVPILRGRSRSIRQSDVLKEARQAASKGHKEIVLTGVSLGAYGLDLKPKTDLAGLLTRLEKIKGLVRIRLSSIEPHDISEKLLKKIGSSNKICPFLHVPFQSGDDDVLMSMNRRLNSADYLTIVKQARTYIKALVLNCDIIVGFPTETEASFNNTLKFLQEINPVRVHLFRFSGRKGTKIIKMKDDFLSPDVLEDRYDRLKKIMQKQSLEYMEGMVGKSFDVLFENRVDGLWQGYTANYIRVGVPYQREDLRNKIKKVRVSSFADTLVLGDIIN